MPFCPKCRDEFQDWVKVCPDCKVELVEKLEPITKPAKPVHSIFSARQDLVTAATYYYPTEAYLASAKLESEGVWSFIADASLISLDWMLTNALGGVKVIVKRNDLKTARQILLAVENPTDNDQQLERCPKCNSTNVRYNRFNIPAIFLIWFISYLFVATNIGGGFPLPIFKREWKCDNCGYKWKNKN